MTHILKADHLVKDFGSIEAVKGISFEIERGEVFSLLGPNGAGKTTTISMLSTLLSPTRGEAWIDGHSIIHNPLQVRASIGVVPQEIALYDDLNAIENLSFFGKMYDLDGTELHKRIAAILEQIGLTDRAKSRVRTYSGGMKRRLNIGVGLLHQPKIIFMDEPTVGIDPQSRRSILDTVKELNQQGMTVLYTTHYMEEAQELSDRVGIIDHGELIALGTQQELMQLVGEHETIKLTVSDNIIIEPLITALAQLPGVFQATAVDHEVVLIVQEAEITLPPAITAANELGIKIRSVEIQEPNLEAVFLQLTGRALRD